MRSKGKSRFYTFGALASGSLLALGCERAAQGGAGSAAVGAESTAAAKDPAPRPSVMPALAAGAADGPRCRVMSVSGAAERAGAPLRAGDTLDRQLPVELGPAATLHLVHTASARQWTLAGPARLFACERGAEEIVLARGTLRTESGSGVRPGAEVWVGTPFGSVRYSDARAELRVTPEALSVRVSSGSVWFSALGGEAAAERELQGGTTTFPARPHRLASDAATARCERAARTAEALATTLLSPSREPLGARAREHVRARQRAHATCVSALATLLAADAGAVQDEPTQAGYSALARYDRQWRGVPDPAAPHDP
jgi:hypothetical protein